MFDPYNSYFQGKGKNPILDPLKGPMPIYSNLNPQYTEKINSMIKVLKRDGSFETFDIDKIKACLDRCATGLNIDIPELLNKIITECYHGITTEKINESIILEARTKVIYNSDYSYFSARILLDNIYKQVFNKSVDKDSFITDYKQGFIDYITIQSQSKKIQDSLYSSITSPKQNTSILYPELGIRFDLQRLSEELIIDNDYLYNIIGIQNLADRYLLKDAGKLLETPQYYHMRIAMGLTYEEDDPTSKAIELYKVYSSRRASGSSPVLFNSGTRHNLISCFLSTPHDSIDGIFDNIWQNARKSKHAGGLGFHISGLRAINSYIKGTRGRSSGIVPWCKLYNDLLLASNQSGLRAGSGCAYLEPWHLEIESFIELRKATGDERRRTHDLNTAIWCNDLFLERVESDSEWTLFDPADVPLLLESFGQAFKLNYLQYESDVKFGKITNYKIIKAKNLMRSWVDNLFGSSSPWMTFKDVSNYRYSNQHEGIITGSNLCCVTGDQLVPTQYGLRSVKELADGFSERDLIVPGLYENVITTPMVKTLLNQEIWKITTQSGFTHKVTGDHPVWTMNEKWVNAENLEIDSYIRVSSHVSNPEALSIFKKGFSPKDSLQKLKDKYKQGFNLSTDFVTVNSENEAIELKVTLHYCGISCNLKYYAPKQFWVLDNFSGVHRQWDKVVSVDRLEQLEDVYCLKVLSSEHSGWTCNGLITKNTEILLHSKASEYDPEFGNKTVIGETAVCCLHPVNLDAHMFFNSDTQKWQMDWDILKNTITVCIRALDNIISLNRYLTEETKKSALSHRAIGLGNMGWADVFYKLNVIQDSEEAVSVSNEIMEKFTYYAIDASADLSASRGPYKTFLGSQWSNGVLPIDTWKSWYSKSNNKAELSVIDFPETMDWDFLRKKVKLGMRNSNVVAIAPTASTAYLTGVEQSIEPPPSVFWTYENLSGMMTVVNENFVQDMKALGIWSIDLVNKITQVDSDISQVPEIPDFYKKKYCLAFNRDMTWLIYSNAARQKWVDQGISFNLYGNTTSKKAIVDLYMLCWKMGLKTTYYFRIPKASTVTKTANTLVHMSKDTKLSEQEICSIMNKEACEMCQ